jgi:hypothetical protein
MKPSDTHHPPGPRTQSTLPVVEEEARVTTRVEETGAVRLRIEPQVVEVPCEHDTTHESVEVEHVPVGRVVDARREPWTDGDAVVVPVYEEVLVRQLVLKEEIRLVRRRHTERVAGTVPLRRARAVVERRRPDGTWEAEPQGATSATRRESSDSPFDDSLNDRSSKT